LEFYRRSSFKPATLGILAGSFNPPTIAHLELARAASAHVDEILFVVPREFPHKEYFGATLRERLEMLDSMGLQSPYSLGISDRGLFIDIARELRPHCASDSDLYFICGRDAAERILTWDYGQPGVVEEMMREFGLLVAERGGRLHAPADFRHRIRELLIQGEHDQVSSTEVRRRIARGEPWEHLVPEPIVERVRAIYS